MKQGVPFRRSWFWKFLGSYLLLLIFPLMLLLSFLNRTVFRAFEHQLFQNQQSSVMRMKTLVDLNIQQLASIHTTLSLNYGASSFVLSDIERTRELMSALKHYAISTPWLEEIVFYQTNSDYLYTGSTTSRVSVYFDKILAFENKEQAKQLQQAMKHPSQIAYLPLQPIMCSGTEKQLIPILIPLKSSAKVPQACFVYFVNGSFLQNMILSAGKNSQEQYFILDDQNSPVAYFGTQPQAEPAIWSEQDLQPTWQTMEYAQYQLVAAHDTHYMLCKITSEESGFTYISVSSMKEIFHVIDTLKIQLVIVMALVGILGAGLIALNMRRTYEPIRSLSNLAKALTPEQPHPHDELQTIHCSIQQISDRYTQLKNSSSVPLQNHFLQRLLQGEYQDCNYLDSMGDVGGVHFEWEHFAVMILLFGREVPSSVSVRELEQVFRSCIPGYLQHGHNRKSYVYVANFDKELMNRFNETTQQLYERLSDLFADTKLVLATGDCCTGIGGVAQSYEQAVLAADYRFVQGYDCVIQHKQLAFDSFLADAYPKQLFEKLRYALSRGETEHVCPALRDIIHYLKTESLPLFYVRSLAYELINILSETLMKLGNEKFSSEFLKTYSSFLSDFDTIDELANALNELCMNICLYIVQGILKEENEKLYKIKYEIEVGYTDVNFSVQALAEHQGMTPAALSQYFKAQTGMTVVEYLTEKRMQKAKMLLRESDLTLNEITEKIGYLNTSSFIRRFKALYGLTPRQYVLSCTEADTSQPAPSSQT